MYKFIKKETNGLEFIELYNPENSSKAIICLNQGGRLSQLEFEGIKLLADFDASEYETNYASSILFPFVNRIKDGKYTFEGVHYTLDCNEADKNNALHGLVYDKTFECIDKDLTSNHGSITLRYRNNGTSEGFPFKFDIQLTYILSKDDFSLTVKITNTDDKMFPFTVGWHPYFSTENLDRSTVNFESKTKYVFDKQQIISGMTALDVEMPYSLKDARLDDGYPLKNNVITFITPQYLFYLKSNSKENYLQLYTPNIPNVIAIEPMTGAADSFNNGIGLQSISPNNNYLVRWNITFENLTDNRATNQLNT